MAKTNASIGALTFKIGADSSALAGDLGKAEKSVSATMAKTRAMTRSIGRNGGGETRNVGSGNPKPNTIATRSKVGAEAANKLATAGGISGLGPIAALGTLGPVALGVGVALGSVAAASRLATDAFTKFKSDQNENATKMSAAGEVLDDFKTGLSDAATSLAGKFINALTGGALDEVRARQQLGRDTDRANAEIFKKTQARQAIEKQKAEEFGKIIGGFKSILLSREAAQLQAAADAQQAEIDSVDFDAESIKDDLIKANTAAMATYGSENALEILDNKRLQEEQKQSKLLAEIAKNTKTEITVVEF